MNQIYYNPVTIIKTENCAKIINTIIEPSSKYLFICSKRFTESDIFKKLKVEKDRVFTDIVNNPTIKSCNSIIKHFKGANVNTIIAVGGGSVIDTAKILRIALMTRSNNIFIRNKVCKFIKFIAIPTNWATSSELTRWATVWDTNKKIKLSVDHKENYATFAIYDTSLTESLPIREKIIGTLDTLSHAYDSMWSKKIHIITQHNAMQAYNIISTELKFISDKDVNEKLINASIYAGLAFSNTKTSIAHSISYPLTLRYGIPHGIASSITLGEICRYTYNTGIFAMNYLWKNNIEPEIIKHIPFKLNEYGVPKKALKELAKESFTNGRMNNFQYKITENDVLKILEGAY